VHHSASSGWLKPDQREVQVLMSLSNLEAGQEIPRDVLIRMLDWNNHQSNYMFFTYNTQTRQLYFKGVIPNDNVKPIQLRRLIQEGIESVQKTADLWYPARWQKPAEEDAGTAAETTE